MPLAAGARLGPYEIIAPAGAGGMGEVYKARDTRLERTVAIKVLPPRFAESDELRLRFEREARVISGLNHPHICTLHDVGNQDGAYYLVMEYLDGETLAQRLKQGPLPLPQALDAAVQIAEALSEAHRHGVVHRDLKPANVMFTRTGVKLLDFGLAKPRGGGIGADDATLTVALSGEGKFMGTLQYMAPEQLEGREADARSDIFAFGCVLYEMLTGKRTFGGETHASVIGAIMSGEPPSLTSLQPVTPASLERLVRQCLRKKADERFQSAHDIKVHLEWLRQPLEEKAAAPAPRGIVKWAWMAATAVLAAALVVSLALRPGAPPAPPPMKLEIQPPERGARFTQLVVSPDGESVAFVANTGGGLRLYVRSLASGAARLVAENVTGVRTFSPDGRSLLFVAEGGLKKADLAGGGIQTVCVCGSQGMDWGRDGTVVLGSGSGPLRRVTASGGEPSYAMELDKERGEVRQRYPVLLPDGKRILYSSTGRSADQSGIYVAPLDGAGKPRRLHPSTGRFEYVHPNRLLVQHGEGLASVVLDLDGDGVAGEPVMAAESVLATAFSSSLDGRVIAIIPGRGGSSADMTLLDRTGKVVTRLGVGSETTSHPEFSPDGKRLVFERWQGGAGADLWVYELERKATSRLTFSPENDGPLTWSSSGNSILFFSPRPNPGEGIYEIAANGVGAEKLIGKTPAHHMHASADGRHLIYEKSPITGGADLWTHSLPGGEAKPYLTGQPLAHPRFSPDSRFVAYTSNETGRNEVYIQTFPAGGGKWQVSTNGGREPKWVAGGKEIYYTTGRKMLAASVAFQGQGVVIGESRELFEIGLTGNNHYAMSPDGRLFALELVSENALETPVSVLLNWKLAGQ